MQSAELGEGMWERKFAREGEGLGIWAGTEHRKGGVKYSGGNTGLEGTPESH